LDRKRTPLPINDLSQYLSCGNIKFGFNEIQVTTSAGSQYGALFSVKDYFDLKVEVLDRFTQLGMNFIISESIIFVPASIAKNEYHDIYKTAIMGKSAHLNKFNGLDEFFAADKGNVGDYCRHQITILIHSDDKNFFVNKVKLAVRTLSELGIVIVREDFNLAKLFWAQLPGNFRYLNQGRITHTIGAKIGGFARFVHHKSGIFLNNVWGDVVTLLRSDTGVPFYFNFHDSKGNGNTLLIGPENAGKTVLVRFLLTQAKRLDARIIYLDLEGGSKNFIEAIGGEFIDISDYNGIKLNPFDLKKFDNNIELYKEWLISAIYPKSRSIDHYQELFSVLAEKLAGNESVTEKISAIREMVKSTNDVSLITGFEEFLGSDVFYKFFDENKDDLSLLNKLGDLVIDFSKMRKNTIVFNSFFGIFLNELENKLPESKPSIIVITSFSSIFGVEHFEIVFEKWLDSINRKNVILIVSASRKEELENNKHYLSLLSKFGTRIFLSDKGVDKYFRKSYSLNDSELYQIRNYASERRMFLFKQDNLSIMLSLNLQGLDKSLKFLVSKDG
jgi:type IV secretion system protein VirB4